MMELRVGAQYWNTSAKSPESSCQSGALRQRRLRERSRARTVPIEVNALGHQRIGVRRDHVGVMPAHVVPAEVIDDEELVRGAGIRQQSGARTGAGSGERWSIARTTMWGLEPKPSPDAAPPARWRVAAASSATSSRILAASAAVTRSVERVKGGAAVNQDSLTY